MIPPIWHFPRKVLFCTLASALGFSGFAPRVCLAQDENPTAPAASSPVAKPMWEFSFGFTAQKGALAVIPISTYAAATGYGFEPGGQVQTGAGCVTSGRPFLFSAAVPEGNYNVTVTLGDQAGASNTTVKAEQRRLMLENVSTAPGKFETRTFTVNVHTPQIPGNARGVGLKPGEAGPPLALNWDNKLTLEFNGTKPCVAAVKIAPAKEALQIFMAGDSTVTDGRREPWSAWAQMLPRFFKPDVAVANYSESGLTLGSFRAQRRLEKILSQINKGDYVFVQFGHNDQKEKGLNVGPFTSYKTNLKDYAAKIRERGANVVFVTPMERRRWQGDQPQSTLADFAQAAREAGAEEKVPVLDLNALSLKLYGALGPEGTKKVFAYATAQDIPGLKEDIKDNTHFSNYGAYELARCIVQEMREKVPALVPSLADGVSPFDPAKPDPREQFTVPASIFVAGEKPDGS